MQDDLHCRHELGRASGAAPRLGWGVAPGEERAACRLDVALQDRHVQLGIPTETEWIEGGTGSELREQVEATKRWWTSTHRVRPRRGPISASPIPPAVISGYAAQLPALLARGVVVAGLLLEERQR